MAGKLNINIRVGRSSGKFNASDSRASKVLVDAIAQQVAEEERLRLLVNVKTLKERLSAALENELLSAFQYLSQNLIGQSSPDIASTMDGYKSFSIRTNGDESSIYNRKQAGMNFANLSKFPGAKNFIRWKVLTRRTVKEKRANNNKFFLHTGSLRRTLASSFARSWVKGTGVVSMSVQEDDTYRRMKASDKRLPVAKLRMTLLPRVFRGDLPGLSSGRISDFNPNMGFEKRLGINGTILEKLAGVQRVGNTSKPEWHRPLLQPVITYWTLFRLPRRAAQIFDDILPSAVTVNRPSSSRR